MDNEMIIAAARQYVNETLPSRALDYTNGRIGLSEYRQELHARLEVWQYYLELYGEEDYVLAAGCKQCISAISSELTRLWKRR